MGEFLAALFEGIAALLELAFHALVMAARRAITLVASPGKARVIRTGTARPTLGVPGTTVLPKDGASRSGNQSTYNPAPGPDPASHCVPTR